MPAIFYDRNAFFGNISIANMDQILFHQATVDELDVLAILFDQYVAKDGRKGGAGKVLLAAARQYAKVVGACRVALDTSLENSATQALYAANGWKEDDPDFKFKLSLPGSTS